jgi:hypothetical protein
MPVVTHRVSGLAIKGEEIPVAHGWLTVNDPDIGDAGPRGWEAEVESERMLPAWLLSEPGELFDVEVTANWATFVGRARVELVSNPRSLKLVNSEPVLP